MYYYDHNWRVLAEYDGSNNIRRKFAYGNTIDEVLFMIDSDSTEYYYTHDHLHSPAVLLTLGGTIHERYEYDAYGNPTIYTGDGGDGNWFDGDETSGDSSALGNPYLFTGRRVDFLDSNDLVLQYNRNRYYDYYTGRWLTQDPLGITPNPQMPNIFAPLEQYEDGAGIYEAFGSSPHTKSDPYGLIRWSPYPGAGPIISTGDATPASKCGTCGPDVTYALHRLRRSMKSYFNSSSIWDRMMLCSGAMGPFSWDIDELHNIYEYKLKNPHTKCGTCDCAETVTVNGKCYSAHEVNYWQWGVMTKLCTGYDFRAAVARNGIALTWGTAWSFFNEDSGFAKESWAWAGYAGKTYLAVGSKSHCKTTCKEYIWNLTATIRPGFPVISSGAFGRPPSEWVEIPSGPAGASGSW